MDAVASQTPKGPIRNHGIHALRGVAATLVVISHAINLSIPRFPEYKIGYFPYRVGGVDIFFVISGYIMVRSTMKYREGKLNGLSFLKKRLLRIVPLYWVITLLISALVFIRPAFSENPFSFAFLLASLTFFPYQVGKETLRTSVIPQAWTLGYEMFFYLLFAFFTSINYKKGVIGLCVLFGALVAVYPFTGNYYTTHFTDPVIMDLMVGMVLAFLPLEKVAKIRWFLICVGFLWLFLFFPHQGESRGNYMRLWAATPGAAMIVTGFSQLKSAGNWKILALGGDISYSVFLTHLYLMKPVASKLKLGMVPSIFILAVVGVFMGFMVNRFLEKPVNKMVQKFAG